MKKQSTGKAVRQYIWKKKRGQILSALGILLFVLILIILAQYNAGKSPFPIWKNTVGLKLWAEVIDPLFGVAVVLITFSIWYNKNQTEWEDELDNRLSVSYIYDNKEVMRCEHAVLSHEADIRAWAQTIGSQMLGGGNKKLKLEPYFEKATPKIDEDQHDSNKRFKHHYFKLFLYELPQNLNGLSKDDLQDYDHIEQKHIDGVLVWRILNRISKDEKNYTKY